MYIDPPYPDNKCNYKYNMRSWEVWHMALAERSSRTPLQMDSILIRHTASSRSIRPIPYPANSIIFRYESQERRRRSRSKQGSLDHECTVWRDEMPIKAEKPKQFGLKISNTLISAARTGNPPETAPSPPVLQGEYRDDAGRARSETKARLWDHSHCGAARLRCHSSNSAGRSEGKTSNPACPATFHSARSNVAMTTSASKASRQVSAAARWTASYPRRPCCQARLSACATTDSLSLTRT